MREKVGLSGGGWVFSDEDWHFKRNEHTEIQNNPNRNGAALFFKF